MSHRISSNADDVLWRKHRQSKRAKQLGVEQNNVCEMCLKEVRVMAMKNTGVCSEICRKLRDGEVLGDFESRTPG